MSAPSPTQGIFVNDRPRPLGQNETLGGLLGELGISGKKGVAAAVNGEVVPRASWPSRTLAQLDRVLVIRATQGG
jgi:sulfur carrier protein